VDFYKELYHKKMAKALCRYELDMDFFSNYFFC